MNQRLKDAYESLRLDNPGLDLPPEELPNIKVKKTAVARQFDAFTDAGLCFEQEYWEREPDMWSDVTEDEKPDPSPTTRKKTSQGESPAEYFRYDGIEYRFAGLGYNCSTLKELRSKQHLPIDSRGFTLIRLDNGLKEQLSTFGRAVFIGTKGVKQNSKHAKKEAALVNQLTRAFSPRPYKPCELFSRALSLDPSQEEGEGCEWVPLSADPMEVMLQRLTERELASSARYRLGLIREDLGPKKFELLVKSLSQTSQEIADEINARGGDTNANAIRKTVSRARKALAPLKCHV